MPEKNEKQLESMESVQWVGKVGEQRRKGSVEKVSSEFEVEERSNGW